MHQTTKESLARRRRIVRLAQRGKTAAQIAATLKLTLDCVYNHLRKAGVKPRRPEMETKLHDKAAVLDVVRRLRNVKAAADELGATRQALYARFAEWNVNIHKLTRGRRSA